MKILEACKSRTLYLQILYSSIEFFSRIETEADKIPQLELKRFYEAGAIFQQSSGNTVILGSKMYHAELIAYVFPGKDNMPQITGTVILYQDKQMVSYEELSSLRIYSLLFYPMEIILPRKDGSSQRIHLENDHDESIFYAI